VCECPGLFQGCLPRYVVMTAQDSKDSSSCCRVGFSQCRVIAINSFLSGPYRRQRRSARGHPKQSNHWCDKFCKQKELNVNRFPPLLNKKHVSHTQRLCLALAHREMVAPSLDIRASTLVSRPPVNGSNNKFVNCRTVLPPIAHALDTIMIVVSSKWVCSMIPILPKQGGR